MSSHECLFLHILGSQSNKPSAPNVPKAPDANPKPSLALSLNSGPNMEERYESNSSSTKKPQKTTSSFSRPCRRSP